MQVWAIPLGARNTVVARSATPFTPSAASTNSVRDEQWRDYMTTAWEVHPRLAVALVSRFPGVTSQMVYRTPCDLHGAQVYRTACDLHGSHCWAKHLALHPHASGHTSVWLSYISPSTSCTWLEPALRKQLMCMQRRLACVYIVVVGR
jgi:hypothetical protein